MIDYEEEWLCALLLRWRGSVAGRASLFALPSAMLACFLVYVETGELPFVPGVLREQWATSDLTASQLWAVATGTLATLLTLRANQGLSRFWEGTGLLHQMRGEWFDSINCCVTFSRAALATRPQDVHHFRHTLVRLMSLCHGSALTEIACSDEENHEVIDIYGLNNTTLQHLKDCKDIHHFNRVEVLLHLIQSTITKALDDGVVKVAPPILSRVYQTLSRGFVNLLNCKKISDTRFPFPFAQTIAILLFLEVVLTPVMLCSVMPDHPYWAGLFSFVASFSMFSINFIAIQLENPFGDDSNDLPMEHFQQEMNKCLLMLLQDNADIVPGISEKRCIVDFSLLTQMYGYSAEGNVGHRVSDFDTSWEDNTEAGSIPTKSGGMGKVQSMAAKSKKARSSERQLNGVQRKANIEKILSEDDGASAEALSATSCASREMSPVVLVPQPLQLRAFQPPEDELATLPPNCAIRSPSREEGLLTSPWKSPSRSLMDGDGDGAARASRFDSRSSTNSISGIMKLPKAAQQQIAARQRSMSTGSTVEEHASENKEGSLSNQACPQNIQKEIHDAFASASMAFGHQVIDVRGTDDQNFKKGD